VSERFWLDHPEWREKTAILQDAHLDWRKLMNLLNPDCFAAARDAVRGLMERFDWDGVNLAELYFESPRGLDAPARFTPMNAEFRALFRQAEKFDPIEIFASRSDPGSRNKVLEFRAGIAARLQEQWLRELDALRAARPHLDLVLTQVDDRMDPSMRLALGADSARVIPWISKYNLTLMIEDPATLWHLGPQRYKDIAERYEEAPKERVAVDINIVERYQNVYPTRQQTGIELFQLVRQAAASFARVALYFENSILAPDIPFLSSAAALVTRASRSGGDLMVDLTRTTGVTWGGALLVDGRPWPITNDSVAMIPAGVHVLAPATVSPKARILDFNGEILSASIPSEGAVQVHYRGTSRALARMDRKPVKVVLDGAEWSLNAVANNTLFLPAGEHFALIFVE
jgi:hypothetical protein